MGQICLWALAVYVGFRLGDMALRGQLSGAFSGRLGGLFVTELLLDGIVPIVLLGSASSRARTTRLFWGALLTTLGVVLNRVNVVLLAVDLKGPMPQIAPAS